MSETNTNIGRAPRRSLFQPDLLFTLFCLLLITGGLLFRFSWMEWNEGASLHPDEYGLTNTLTQLSMPDSLGEYFNTRLSPISPYHKYNPNGQLTANGPDNRMRWGQWPIILIRAAGEISGNTGYDEIRILGRQLSALADTLSILLVFLIGCRLYSEKTGLLAAALSSLAVMQIQQSHFMTVDNFAALFTIAAIYASVRIAQLPALQRDTTRPTGGSALRINPRLWPWIGLFGVFYGMAVASKINLVPLAGMVVIALFLSIADIRLKSKKDLLRILQAVVLLVAISAAVSVLTFRVTQPMTFRTKTGDTGFFTISLNPDWLDSMEVAQSESKGIGGGPPSEQWAHRTPVLFPLMNMVFWGMGLPLGVAAWLGTLAAAWQAIKERKDWRAHLIPLLWVGGYFLFMSTRWVTSIRYFLPIYPLLCLFAAWGLLRLWGASRNKAGRLLAVVSVILVAGSALVWAHTFTQSVYAEGHTRITASRWIVENIPGAVNLVMQSADGEVNLPLPAQDSLVVSQDYPFISSFSPPADSALAGIFLPKAIASAPLSQLKVTVSTDLAGGVIGETVIDILDTAAGPAQGSFTAPQAGEPLALRAGERYYLIMEPLGPQQVILSKLVLANESWDEGLPVRIDGWDPFGQLYNGITMEVRWYDDENKREMFLERIGRADYIFLPSQRGIWSTCRIPMTYPMTIDYYQALFNGELGFDLVAQFTAEMKIGPLYISDVGGQFSLGEPPTLPLCNFNPLAAEEAFSVYDHPPVWIFKKRADFDIEQVREILSSADLSQVVVESPRDATPPWKLDR